MELAKRRKEMGLGTLTNKPVLYSNRFVCLTVGMSCLFTFSFFLTVGGIDLYFGRSYQNTYLQFGYLVVSLVLVSAMSLMRKAFVRKAISFANIGFTLVWSAELLYIYAGGRHAWLPPLFVVLLGITVHTILLFQWNLHFALNRIEDVEAIVWIATASSIVMLFLFLNSSFKMPLPAVCALPLVSTICCWWVETTDSSNPSSSHSIQATTRYDQEQFGLVKDPKKISVLFFGLRIGLSVLYGIASGTFSNFFILPKANNTLALLIAVLIVGATIAVLVVHRKHPTSSRTSIMLPFLIAFAVISVYLGSEASALSRVAIGVAWLSGHVFSLIQLPTYREMTEVGLLEFAVLEKAALMIPFTISAVMASSFVVSHGIYQRYAEQVDSAVVYYMLMMVIVYGIALARHLVLYYPRQQRASTRKSLTEKADQVDFAADRFLLTKRESEVLFYLAKGYSRPYIEKKLFISKGTAKTHIFRIFQKLGVSSQDELIELIEQNGT